MSPMLKKEYVHMPMMTRKHENILFYFYILSKLLRQFLDRSPNTFNNLSPSMDLCNLICNVNQEFSLSPFQHLKDLQLTGTSLQ